MKRLLLLLALATSLSVSAQIAPERHPMSIDPQATAFGHTPSASRGISRAAGDGFDIKFCQSIASWYKLSSSSGITYKCYIYITPDMATAIAGNRITAITFSAGPDTSKSGTVFVTEDLSGSPTTTTACTIEDSYARYQNGLSPFQTITLQQPYTIKANTGFYFGYTVKNCNTADYPVGIDGASPNKFCGTVELLASSGASTGTYPLDERLGTNLFLAATTQGEAEGFTNCFQLGNLSLGDFTLPVVDRNAVSQLNVDVTNYGINALTTIEYAITINGVEGETKVLDTNIPGGEQGTVQFPAPDVAAGKNSFALNVKKMNGVETSEATSAQCIALDNVGYDRKFVVEEGTGTWCGWCPRGIVGLEQMSAKYPEKFIGIAIHSSDAMASTSYAPVINRYFSGFPSCIINRDPLYVVDPNFDDLDLCYSKDNYWAGQRGAAKVDMTVATDADNSFYVTATTTFAFSESNADYKLAFVIIEDGIKGIQTNNYAGGNYGAMGGWENRGSSAMWTYEHTARDIFAAYGLDNSIPSTIVAEEPMTFHTTLSGSNVTKTAETAVIALVLDTATGTILNATKVMAEDYGEVTAINSVPQTTAHTDYFDLSGRRVSRPAKGSIVICRQGGVVSKRWVR